ncbi:MAG TPA: HIT family protein [Geobacteraceae bacterium]|nr:HIT family protein [Geobacteraceae bacterium]
MNDFTLDPRLSQDCFVVGKLRISLLLLMKNSLVPWFILVPRRTATELYELELDDQAALLEEINLVSRFLKEFFKVEKLNVAAIGNIVRQLHVHVIGRNTSDFCWPNVVWGTKESRPYTDEQITAIRAAADAMILPPSRPQD